MAYTKEPLFYFENNNDLGLETLPLHALIVIGNSEIVYKIINPGEISNTTTIQTAINEESIVPISSNTEIIRVDSDIVLENKKEQLLLCITEGITLSDGTYPYTIYLPQNPYDRDVVYIMDGSKNAQNRPPYISNQSADGTYKINGEDDSLVLDVNFFYIILIYDAATNNWVLGGK